MRRGLNPARELAPGDGRISFDRFIALIERRDVMEDAAGVGLLVGAPKFVADFLDRLKTIRGEARTNHINAGKTFAGQLFNKGKRIGLKPLVAAEAALKAHRPFVLMQIKPRGQCRCSFMALRFVDVAQSRALRGYPMETCLLYTSDAADEL